MTRITFLTITVTALSLLSSQLIACPKGQSLYNDGQCRPSGMKGQELMTFEKMNQISRQKILLNQCTSCHGQRVKP